MQQTAFVASIVQPQPVVNYPPLPAAVTVPPASDAAGADAAGADAAGAGSVNGGAASNCSGIRVAYRCVRFVATDADYFRAFRWKCSRYGMDLDDLLRNQVPVEASRICDCPGGCSDLSPSKSTTRCCDWMHLRRACGSASFCWRASEQCAAWADGSPLGGGIW
ncbi:MAG UNVERIFIED_CONTAM: hypothetical protein LVR18_46530 [Planctomycetaceae bacterium]